MKREVSVTATAQADAGTMSIALRESRRPIRRVLTRSACLLLAVVIAAVARKSVAEEHLQLECTPRRFDVIPGEPIRLELTVRSESAATIRWHVPEEKLLKLRAVEKVPVQRTSDGLILHKRIVIWQALEPGRVRIDGVLVEAKGRKLQFPEVTISVREPSI